MHRILGVKYLRYKMKIENSPICNKCNQSEQTLIHLFTQCPSYSNLWQDLEYWINNKTNFHLNVTPEILILGYINTDSFSIAINAILMTKILYI